MNRREELIQTLEPVLQEWIDWCGKNDETPEASSGARIVLDALAEALSPQEWLPIETAPPPFGELIIVACWKPEHKAWIYTLTVFEDEHWREQFEWVEDEPTHWRYPPAPPTPPFLSEGKGAPPAGSDYKLGDRVRKTKGSSWQGRVCGFYSTALTPVGICVESEREPGSVQIYPASALEPFHQAATPQPPTPEASLTTERRG